MINLSMAEPDNLLRPRITVVGVGGGGGNAINNMIRSNLEGCEFIAANTDAQALAQSLAARKIQLGVNLSRGLGAGSKPNIGCAAAEEALGDIMSILDGSDMLFVTAGMGGGTGTGAAPVIARAARDAGILTVGVVTKPFHFEGTHRMRQAEFGIAELQKYVDTLIVIPNQNLFRVANERTTFAEAFRMADEVLHSGVRGITDLMVMPGFMNLDFADVKTVMGEMGKAMMGTGEAEGDNRAIEAAEAAISNPLLDDISMKGARGVLINITGGLDMTLFEVDQAANRIREEVDPEAQIKVGSTLGDGMEGRIRVSVIATGIDAELEQKSPRGARTESMAPSATMRTTQAAPQRQAQATVTPIKTQASVVEEQPVQKPRTQQQSYFTMPAAVAPKTVTTMTSSPVTVRTQEATPVTVRPVQAQTQPVMQEMAEAEEQMPQEEPVAVQQQPQQTTGLYYDTGAGRGGMKQQMSHQQALPVREIPPVQQAQRQRTVGAAPSRQPSQMEEEDLRITQLTTAAQTSSGTAAHHQNAATRAQSLFQRITGFGMVRPSAHRDEEEWEREEGEAQQQTRSVQPHLDVEVQTERQGGLSSSESDLLDIPAFLRRQSNH